MSDTPSPSRIQARLDARDNEIATLRADLALMDELRRQETERHAAEIAAKDDAIDALRMGYGIDQQRQEIERLRAAQCPDPEIHGIEPLCQCGVGEPHRPSQHKG